MTTEAVEAAREVKACPVLSGDPRKRAYRADVDARQLVALLRDEDPRQAWGRIALWGAKHPERLAAMVIALAARVNPKDRHSLDWLTPMGGTAALHPDYDSRAEGPRERAARAIEAGRLAA